MVLAKDGSGADRFSQEVLERLPLAEAVLMLFSHVLDRASLDDLYRCHRGRCYERALSFAEVVYLVRDALVEHGGSGRASFVNAQERQRLPTSVRAVYGKLSRMPPAVSMALLRESTCRLRELLPRGCSGIELPASLAGLDAVILDGKTLKHVRRRLRCLRNRRGKVNSGKLLVALSPHSGLVDAVNASANSEANDVSLVEGLLSQMGPGRSAGGRLYVADRQFCDLPRVAGELVAGGDHFLVRHNANVHFHPDAGGPRREGKDKHGRRYVQEWGRLGAESHPLRRRVRKITLHRPGADGVSVLTDLLDERAFPAEDLLEAYLARWDIERVFQQVTEVFDLKHLIGGRPQATIFQAAFCLLLYNLIQVVKAYVARAGGREIEEVSTENLFTDCKKQLVSWTILTEPQTTVELFTPAPNAREVRRRLERLTGGLWRQHWQKSPRQATHGKTKKTVYPSKGYTNVWKLLKQLQ